MGMQFERQFDQLRRFTPTSLLSFLEMEGSLPDINGDELQRVAEQMDQRDIVRYYQLLGRLPSEVRAELWERAKIRPKKLYHGSISEVAVFEPRIDKQRDLSEPAQIFAAPTPLVAAMFLVPHRDEFVVSGSYDGGDTVVFVTCELDYIKANDHGGYIYDFPPDTFDADPVKGLGLMEWTSQHNVVPTAARHYPSALQVIKEFGVKIYSLSRHDFEQFKSSSKQAELLADMQPEK